MSTKLHSGSVKVLFTIFLTALLFLTGWSTYKVYHISNQRAAILDHFAQVNDVYYGLLSVNSWEKHIRNIADKQIKNFELNDSQDSIIRIQINTVLNDLITKAFEIIEENDNTFKEKIRKFAVNSFVDQGKLREQVPEFTEVILKNIKDPENKERMKILANEKLDELTAQTYDSLQQSNFNFLFKVYGVEDKEEFNDFIGHKTTLLNEKAFQFSYLIIAILVVFLLLWFAVWKVPALRNILFFLSIFLALLVLLAGLSTPMIEIDARIAKVDLVLLGEHIIFENQMLFYRSKSILQVVEILLRSGPVDSVIVGFLILAFSVILPVSKLISMLWYKLKTKIRSNKVINWMAFHAGKWSMADVMVVAIFMSYVAFDGILDSQLQLVERDLENLRSIATNNTSLKAGFILFLVYVLYSLILSEILKKVIKKQAVEKA